MNDVTESQAASEAYKRLSKKLHPDVGGSTESMRDLNAINDVAKKFTFSFNAPPQAEAEVEVDTRGSKTPAESEPESGISEMGQVLGEHPPEQKFRARAGAERDAVCNLVRWKLAGAIHNAWRDDLELVYQAKLAQHREYWLEFMKPDRLYSAEEVDALMKSLWVAESCSWSQELLLAAVQAMKI